MTIWTTFCPSKLSWELTYVETEGKYPNSEWQKNIHLIDESLKKLKDVGIYGIRLAIYPTELTVDGRSFNWKPIDTMLDLCFKKNIAVDLCIGPFQYPHYPGIYLPKKMQDFVFDNKRCLDTVPQLYKYGISFLKEQIAHFGKDKRIHGFHFANEWPDAQKVSGHERVKTCISHAFMLEAAKYLKDNTTKPILLNTNIDISERKRLVITFGETFEILGNRGKLGFDIYPSQFTWKRYPIKNILYFIFPYARYFKRAHKKFESCEFYFTEVEAQPWGGGQSWYQLIKQEKDPSIKVLQYFNDSLVKTWDKYIKNTNCGSISLWGSEFWLAADKMGVGWPLKQVKNIRRK